MAKSKKTKLLLCIVASACLVTLAIFFAQAKPYNASAADETREYALLSELYTIPNYDESVEIVDPTGQKITPQNGSFVLTKIGAYEIKYSAKTVILEVYENVPLSSFEYSFEMKASYKAGDTVKFPKAEITSDIGTAQSYTVILERDGNIVDTYADVSTEFSRQMTEAGKYIAYYCRSDVFGYMTNDCLEFEVVNSRNLIVPKLDDEWYFNTPLFLSGAYGFYNGEKYKATLDVIDPNGEKVAVSDKFVPEKLGKYKFTFTSEIEGETLTSINEINVVYDYSGYFTATKDITAITPSQMPSYVASESRGKGVEVRAERTGAVAYYNRIIDLRNYTKNDNLISFYPIADSGSKLTEIKISLVDIYDENNVVTMQFWGSSEDTRHSYALANNGSGFFGRNNETWSPTFGKLREKYGAVAHFNSFSPSAAANNPFTVRYDWETQQLWSRLFYQNTLIYDLDDDAYGGNLNDWKGFTTGEVYLRIDFSGVSLKNSGVAISEIAKTSFRSELSEWSDDADFIKFDYTEPIDAMPLGVIGVSYDLPRPHGYDVVIGDYDFDVRLIYDPDGKAKDISAEISDGAFVPNETGKYGVEYIATSPFGVSVKSVVEFAVASSAPPISVTMSEPEKIELDKYYKLPSFTVSGGSGTLNVTKKVLYNGNVVVPNAANKIFLSDPGEITVNVTVVDFLGTKFEKSFEIKVVQDEPLVRIYGVPLAVEFGKTVTFPDFTAIDLQKQSGESGYYMDKKITVNDVPIDMNTRRWTVPDDVSKVIVRYIASNDSRNVSREYEVKVINTPKNPYDYFLYDAEKVSARVDDTKMSFASEDNFTVGFPYALAANGLKIELDGSKVKSSQRIVVQLEDYYNDSIALTLVISDDGSADSQIKSNSSAGRIPGKLADARNGRFVFTVDNVSRYVTDTNGAKILLLESCDNGDAFIGFPSEVVRVRMGVENVTEGAELGIFSAMGQTFNSFFTQYGDRTPPEIVVRGNTRFTDLSVGDTVIVPSADAYDIFNPDTSVTVSVTAPSGEKLYSNVTANTDLSFEIEEYGYYLIHYTAYDGKFNKAEKRFNVLVKDVIPPEVTVNGKISNSYKLGAKFSVPTVSATDNVDENLIVLCFFEKSDFSREIVEQGSQYIFDKSGRYTFVVYVRDANYNVVRLTYEMEVGK